ncbi:MAG: RidA family protein, partial [bacterium]|nr:RidA family protein [bacterium]
QRTAINPTTWAKGIYNQGEVIEGYNRLLNIAGQVSVQDDADAPFGVVAKHPGDMRAQMTEVLANIDAVLDGAGMGRENLTSLTFYVTDMDAGLGNFDVFMEWIGDHRPPQSFIGVSAIALEGLVLEIEATAAQ